MDSGLERQVVNTYKISTIVDRNISANDMKVVVNTYRISTIVDSTRFTMNGTLVVNTYKISTIVDQQFHFSRIFPL